MKTEPGTLAHHLSQLHADAAHVEEMLHEHVPPAEGPLIHPEALVKSAKLQTSLSQIIHALTHHEHLVMTSDDVWEMLTLGHHHDHDKPIPKV